MPSSHPLLGGHRFHPSQQQLLYKRPRAPGALPCAQEVSKLTALQSERMSVSVEGKEGGRLGSSGHGLRTEPPSRPLPGEGWTGKCEKSAFH